MQEPMRDSGVVLEKPRVLIADDSRIVRATLIKRIQGIFDFREAYDGQNAWETLLLDPTIRVVITDLTMPRLDGYGLLERIRSSKISRIRSVPVIVISGSDEQAERDRVKAAGATELITKGIATAQLLSHLNVLAELVDARKDLEGRLSRLIRFSASKSMFLPPEAFLSNAIALHAAASRHEKSFFVLEVSFAVLPHGDALAAMAPPASAFDGLGAMVKHSIRANDCAVRTGDSTFVIAISNSDHESACGFGNRIRATVENANLLRDMNAQLIGSCGIADADEVQHNGTDQALPAAVIASLMEIAHRRAALGFGGKRVVIGCDEENALTATSAELLQ